MREHPTLGAYVEDLSKTVCTSIAQMGELMEQAMQSAMQLAMRSAMQSWLAIQYEIAPCPCTAIHSALFTPSLGSFHRRATRCGRSARRG